MVNIKGAATNAPVTASTRSISRLPIELAAGGASSFVGCSPLSPIGSKSSSSLSRWTLISGTPRTCRAIAAHSNYDSPLYLLDCIPLFLYGRSLVARH